MLARMAAHFYWLGRYVERTEHTAILLEFQLRRLVDTAADELAEGWRVIYEALGQPAPSVPDDVDEAETFMVADAFTLSGGVVEDQTNPSSLVSCWGMAIENARQIRARLPLRVWVCLNRGFLWLRDSDFSAAWKTGPAAQATEAIDRMRLLAGVVDTAMARNDAWRFLELGRYVERLQQQVALLASWDRSRRAREEAEEGGPSLSWTDLLRVCGAFEHFCRDRSLVASRETVLSFLIRNPEVARSLRFATSRIEETLRGIDPVGSRYPLAPPHRMALRLAASLEAADEADDEVAQAGRNLHFLIMAAYVDYEVTAGLPS